MVFLILYVFHILLIGNNFETLSKVKIQLATQLQMKDLGKVQYVLSRPESRSDPFGGSEPSSGCETQDWDSLPDFFFLKPNLYLWVWPTSYNIIKISYQKNYHRSGVHQNLYTFTESHLHIQN